MDTIATMHPDYLKALEGSRLPNGATILEIEYDNANLMGIVFARSSGFQPWVTWEFYRGDLASTSCGHYFSNLVEAALDFQERTKKIH